MIVGVVAALAGEARALAATAEKAPRILLRTSGVGAAAATEAAEELIRAGAEALLSWGVAGALDPTLTTGTICVPAMILDARGASAARLLEPGAGGTSLERLERFEPSVGWRAGVLAALAAQNAPLEGARLSEGALLSGTCEALATAVAKRAAHRGTGAMAIDMESGAVARVALKASLPFMALRVIVDAADDEIPGTVVRASRAGRVRIGRLLGGLLAAPGDLDGLLRLARRYRLATRRLRAVAPLWPGASPSGRQRA